MLVNYVPGNVELEREITEVSDIFTYCKKSDRVHVFCRGKGYFFQIKLVITGAL